MIGGWPETQSDRRFHYCSEQRARTIAMDDVPVFWVGDGGSRFGWGLYATDIEPEDFDTIDEVNAECFAGTRTPPELSFVLVFRAGPPFERMDTAEWLIDAGAPNEPVEIDALIVEICHWDGATWNQIASWDGTGWDFAPGWYDKWS